jgi:hypothetical protein
VAVLASNKEEVREGFGVEEGKRGRVFVVARGNQKGKRKEKGKGSSRAARERRRERKREKKD